MTETKTAESKTATAEQTTTTANPESTTSSKMLVAATQSAYILGFAACVLALGYVSRSVVCVSERSGCKGLQQVCDSQLETCLATPVLLCAIAALPALAVIAPVTAFAFKIHQGFCDAFITCAGVEDVVERHRCRRAFAAGFVLAATSLAWAMWCSSWTWTAVSVFCALLLPQWLSVASDRIEAAVERVTAMPHRTAVIVVSAVNAAILVCSATVCGGAPLGGTAVLGLAGGALGAVIANVFA